MATAIGIVISGLLRRLWWLVGILIVQQTARRKSPTRSDIRDTPVSGCGIGGWRVSK